MSTGEWIFIGAVCLAPLPLVAMLLREFVISYRRSSHTRFDCPAAGINNRMV